MAPELIPLDGSPGSFVIYENNDLDTTFTVRDNRSHLRSSNNESYSSVLQPAYDEGSCGSHDISVHLSTAINKQFYEHSVHQSTAVNKQLKFQSYKMGCSRWHQKSIEKWTPNNTVDWAFQVAHDNNIVCEDVHNFGEVNGKRLLAMNEAEFNDLEPKCGSLLYNALQNFKCKSSIDETQKLKIKRSYRTSQIPRSKKKTKETTVKAWEFLKGLLENPECNPSVIRWEDAEQKIFRFVKGKEVAKLWGSAKGNPNMNYEKFTRNMRYQYEKGTLEPVEGKLLYKFGPHASGC